ncbi:MAG: tetratricopeptide repeat protein [Bacteroidetes bacterium]|nr:tetratricopeptide repeat protein [Bacteroidota bacterium]
MRLLTHQIFKVILFTYLLLAVGMSFSYAQRKKNKTKVQEAPTAKKDDRQSAAAESYFMEGLRYSMTEDKVKAISSFDQALRLDPNNAAAHYKLAEVFLEQEKYELAQSHAGKAVALDKSNEWYYMLLAETQLRAGNANEAAATVETMLAKTKASPHNSVKLAQLYLQLNQTDKALLALNKAEKALGVDEGIVELKQRLYLGQQKITEAIAEGEKLVAHFPEQSA